VDLTSIVHWDGSCWSLHSTPGGAIRGLAGAGPGRLWAIAGMGTVSYWDGRVWAIVKKTNTVIYQAGGDDEHVWAVGEMNSILGWPAKTVP